MAATAYQATKSAQCWSESFEQLKLVLILKAKLKYGYILPKPGKSDLLDCFTLTATHLIFWFNTTPNHTRTLTAKISAE